jgi:hypothetical protein
MIQGDNVDIGLELEPVLNCLDDLSYGSRQWENEQDVEYLIRTLTFYRSRLRTHRTLLVR